LALNQVTALPEWKAAGSSSSECRALRVSAAAFGDTTLPSGSYQVRLYGGPDLDPIDRPSTVTVNAR
jgi:hypothetical protein